MISAFWENSAEPNDWHESYITKAMQQTITAANAHYVIQTHGLLHVEETDVFADSGCRGVENAKKFRPNTPR